MNKSTLILLSLFVILVLVVVLPDLSWAQTPPPPPTKPTQNPIDGGLAILAAAGGAYAFKKLKNRKD